MNLSRLRIGQRLTLVFGLVIAVFLAMAAAAYAGIAALDAEMKGIVGSR